MSIAIFCRIGWDTGGTAALDVDVTKQPRLGSSDQSLSEALGDHSFSPRRTLDRSINFKPSRSIMPARTASVRKFAAIRRD